MLLLRQGREWPSDHAANSLAAAWTTRLDASSLICFVPTFAFKFLIFPECWIVGRPLTKWRRC